MPIGAPPSRPAPKSGCRPVVRPMLAISASEFGIDGGAADVGVPGVVGGERQAAVERGTDAERRGGEAAVVQRCPERARGPGVAAAVRAVATRAALPATGGAGASLPPPPQAARNIADKAAKAWRRSRIAHARGNDRARCMLLLGIVFHSAALCQRAHAAAVSARVRTAGRGDSVTRRLTGGAIQRSSSALPRRAIQRLSSESSPNNTAPAVATPIAARAGSSLA